MNEEMIDGLLICAFLFTFLGSVVITIDLIGKLIKWWRKP